MAIEITTEPVSVPSAGAIAALASYQQGDMDGVMVLVSRQAIDECLPYLRAAVAPLIEAQVSAEKEQRKEHAARLTDLLWEKDGEIATLRADLAHCRADAEEWRQSACSEGRSDLAQARAAAIEEAGWQPIETAPKDRNILAYCEAAESYPGIMEMKFVCDPRNPADSERGYWRSMIDHPWENACPCPKFWVPVLPKPLSRPVSEREGPDTAPAPAKPVCPICKGASRFDQCSCHYEPVSTAPAPAINGGETPGPYEPRICKGMPADCCDYGVVSLSAGREVCRVWTEADARRIAAALAAADRSATPPAIGKTQDEVFRAEGEEAGKYKGNGNAPMQKEDYDGSCQ